MEKVLMNLVGIATTALTLMSCGDFQPKGDITFSRFVDPRISKEVNEVEGALGFKVNYKITVGKLGNSEKGKILGVCYKGLNPRIVIDTEAISKGDISLKIVVLHEIAHCSLRLGHNDAGLMDDSCTVSVMDTYASPKKCEVHFDRYVNEVLGN